MYMSRKYNHHYLTPASQETDHLSDDFLVGALAALLFIAVLVILFA